MNTIQRLLALTEMGIRRTTQRGQRRRRVLVDERILTPSREETANPSSQPRPGGRTPRYAEAALIHRQPRICSFVPIRPWTVLIWFLAGLSFVVAHATAFALAVCYVPTDFPIDLAPFHFSGPRSLSNWTSSVVLMLAAVLAALIVQFRQHRIDDYRGEYRVWYYVITGLVIASVNASIGGHQILRQSAVEAAATYQIRHVSLWINGLLSIVVTGICVRMLLEVRASRGTVVTGVLAGTAYLCHRLLTAGIWPIPSADLQMLAVGFSRLAGHYLLAMSLVVYSRYVMLDAQGRISQATTKKKKTAGKKRPAQTESASPPVASAQPRPQLDRSTEPEQPNVSAQDDNPEMDDAEEPATLQMSKTERRRMRKQKRRERRAA